MKRYPVFSQTKKCQQLYKSVETFLGNKFSSDVADIILVGGGDGWMLKMMRTHHALQIPFFGLHCGTLGFLMNRCEDSVCDPEGPSLKKLNLSDLLREDLQIVKVYSMSAEIHTRGGEKISGFAFNDVTVGGNVLDFFRMKIHVHDTTYECEGTGLVVSTPLGSTGYTASLQVPILPLESDHWNIAGIATGSFTYASIQAQEIQIEITGKSNVSIGLDGYNHVVQDVTKIMLRPSNISASLAFHPSQDFLTRRYHLEQQKLGLK